MKKYFALLLALLLAMSLFACGPAKPAGSEDDTTAPGGNDTADPGEQTQPDETGPAGDDDPSDRDLKAEFLALVDACDGFEICYSRTDGRWVYIGGKDGIYWMIECADNGDEGFHYADLTEEGASGIYRETLGGTVSLQDQDADEILDQLTGKFLYWGQDKIDASITPSEVNDADVICDRYSLSFGAVAYDIAREYGVTMRFSDTDSAESGFEPVYVRTGSDVNAVESPAAEQPEGDIDDPEYWNSLFGVNICPFTITKNDDGTRYYFRDGGSFKDWLNTEMNTDGYYYYNDRVISKDGKWATDPDFDDAFSSFCEYVMVPYDGPTLSDEEQAALRNQKGTLYAVHSWTPLKLWGWGGMALVGDEKTEEDPEFKLSGLRSDFCDQEWISVYLGVRPDEEWLSGHGHVYAFPHKDIAEYHGVLTEEDRGKAMASAEYECMPEETDSLENEVPVFRFYIENEFDGETYAGDVDLIFAFDSVITYYITVTTHEAGWEA